MAVTRTRIVRFAAALGCVLSVGAQAFSLEQAQSRSLSLSQAQMNEAWELIEAALPLAASGRHAEALVKLRQGLAIHPAEAGTHLLAASLAEAAQQWPQAATHWQAVLSFAASGSQEQRKAESALRRILPLLEGGSDELVSCSVLGIQAQARQSQCDPAGAASSVAVYGEDLFEGLRLQIAVGPKARVKDPFLQRKACVDARGLSFFSWHAVLNHSGNEDWPFAQEQVQGWLDTYAVAIGSDEVVAKRHLLAAREGRCHVILDTPQRMQQIAGQLPAGWKLSARTTTWGELFGSALSRANFANNAQRMDLVRLGGDFASGWFDLGRAKVTTKAKFDAMAQEIRAKGFSKETSSRVMEVFGRVLSGKLTFNQGKKEAGYLAPQQEVDDLHADAVRLYLSSQLR